MPDYQQPRTRKQPNHSTAVVHPPRQHEYDEYAGDGTRLCKCRGYVLAVFRDGDLVRIELHHLHNNGCVPNIETLHLKSWLGTLGPVKLPQAVLEAYRGDGPEPGRTRPPSRQRRDRTADGRERR
jgi:hypothetical protein